MRSFLSTVLVTSSLVSVTACMNKGGAATDDSAESAVDSADSANAEGDMMMAAVDGSSSNANAVTAASVSAAISANITARYSPSGCATVTTDGDTIKTTYDGCTGPRGLLHVTGELDITVAVSPAGAITTHATSTDLEVNGATLDVDATGTYTVTGTSHSLSVHSTGTGTGPRGRNIDHQGDYTISWDPTTACHSIDGEWSTDIGLLNRSNTVSLSRCGAGCPTGSIAHNYLGNRTLTVTFDGTATAQWSLSGPGAGASGTVSLSCQ